MSRKKRIDTLRVLISGHTILGVSTKRNALIGETNSIDTSSRVKGRNGWLLQVLYTTRALDTCLATVATARGLAAHPPSLGEYLKVLRSHSLISETERAMYQANIVTHRNRYMHSAGEFPNQLEADDLLAEMQGCLATILAATT